MKKKKKKTETFVMKISDNSRHCDYERKIK